MGLNLHWAACKTSTNIVDIVDFLKMVNYDL